MFAEMREHMRSFFELDKKEHEKQSIKQLTFRDKISKFDYLYLKQNNKLYSSSAKAVREAAIKSKGAVRGHLRFLKNKEGQMARLYHVGLCFLKGKKYSEVEPNVEKKNKLSIESIYNHLYNFVTYEFKKVLRAELEKFLAE